MNRNLDPYFTSLYAPRRVWAVSSVHGDIERLASIHDAIYQRFRTGDRIVYLGNYTGYGLHSVECVDEILSFRRLVLSFPSVIPDDIVYLRGSQEDLWQRLMQLHFCPTPVDTLLWMLASGLSNTFKSYGIDSHDGIMAAREGTIFLTRWLTKVREAVRRHSGHDIFNTQFKRAAYTQMQDRFPLLFVNAGIDPHKRLSEQNDALWWGGAHFKSISESYDPFEKVIRGFDPHHEGVYLNCVTASLDGGCGFGGSLVCAGMDGNGEFFELLEA